MRENICGGQMSALRQHNWNRTETAKALGIHKTTLFRKIEALGLTPPTEQAHPGVWHAACDS